MYYDVLLLYYLLLYVAMTLAILPLDDAVLNWGVGFQHVSIIEKINMPCSIGYNWMFLVKVFLSGDFIFAVPCAIYARVYEHQINKTHCLFMHGDHCYLLLTWIDFNLSMHK